MSTGKHRTVPELRASQDTCAGTKDHGFPTLASLQSELRALRELREGEVRYLLRWHVRGWQAKCLLGFLSGVPGTGITFSPKLRMGGGG